MDIQLLLTSKEMSTRGEQAHVVSLDYNQ